MVMKYFAKSSVEMIELSIAMLHGHFYPFLPQRMFPLFWSLFILKSYRKTQYVVSGTWFTGTLHHICHIGVIAILWYLGELKLLLWNELWFISQKPNIYFCYKCHHMNMSFFSFYLLTLLIVKQFMNYITLSVYKPGPCRWETSLLKHNTNMVTNTSVN